MQRTKPFTPSVKASVRGKTANTGECCLYDIEKNEQTVVFLVSIY